MKGLGISFQLRKGQIVVQMVVAEGTVEDPKLVTAKSHTSGINEDMGQALSDFARDLRSVVTAQAPDAIVVRSQDRPPGPAKFDVVKKRGMVEGVALAVGRETVKATLNLQGAQIGKKCGAKKAEIDQRGEDLAGVDAREAAAAAIAALA